MPSVSLLSFALFFTCFATFSSAFRLHCGSCDSAECPTSCLAPLPDPCRCCDFVCGATEGEPCGHGVPCEHPLSCQHTENGEVCSCRDEKGMICGSNEVTYASICQFRKETANSNLSIAHQGPCEFAPEIVSPPTNTKITVGEPLALDCEVKGYPIPTVTWTFTARDGKKKQLPSDDHWTAVQLRGGPEHLMVTSWVQIIESRPSDAGYYECRAKNTLGSARAEATVSMKNSHYRG